MIFLPSSDCSGSLTYTPGFIFICSCRSIIRQISRKATYNYGKTIIENSFSIICDSNTIILDSFIIFAETKRNADRKKNTD